MPQEASYDEKVCKIAQCFHLYSKILLFHTKLTKSREAAIWKSPHRQWNRHSNMTIVFYTVWITFRVKSKVYIFISNTLLSIKLWTYRLLACDFVRKCFAKISRRKFPDNLKSAILQNTSTKTSVMESFLMKLQG